MSQVRKQPLPVGRFWINVIDDAPGGTHTNRIANWEAWAAANPQRVAIDKREATDAGATWYLFRVLKPIKFDQIQFGFPNDAGGDVNTAADTSQRPPVPTVTSMLQDFLDGLTSGLTSSGFGRVAMIGLLLYAFSKTDK
jgi:hypothetical protein